MLTFLSKLLKNQHPRDFFWRFHKSAYFPSFILRSFVKQLSKKIGIQLFNDPQRLKWVTTQSAVYGLALRQLLGGNRTSALHRVVSWQFSRRGRACKSLHGARESARCWEDSFGCLGADDVRRTTVDGYGSVLFFSRPRSEGWPHHGRTFSIYPRPLSFCLALPRRVLCTSWCCPFRPCVAFFACVHLALFLALYLSPGVVSS